MGQFLKSLLRRPVMLPTIPRQPELGANVMPDATPVYVMILRQIVILLLILGLGACASAPVPTLELDRARSALARAEQAGAADYAPVDYGMAREAVDSGRALIEKRENTAARQALQVAEVRAELAAAKSAAAKLRGEVQQKESENANLRRELLGEGRVP